MKLNTVLDSLDNMLYTQAIVSLSNGNACCDLGLTLHVSTYCTDPYVKYHSFSSIIFFQEVKKRRRIFMFEYIE